MIQLVQEYVSIAARKHPNKTAVDFKDKKITYKQLDEETNKIANVLRSIGCKRNDRVAFCLNKSIDSIKAVIGILKADAAYVPLDAQSPDERLLQIVQDCMPIAIVCNDETKDKAQKLSNNVVSLTNIKCDASPPTYCNIRSDMAYILYTSGSTGKPKGVMITHSNIIHFIEWVTSQFNMSEHDVFSNHAPMHFDLSTFDMYSAFSNAATLCPIPPELNSYPEQLVDYLQQKKITILMCVPSILSYIARTNAIQPDRMPSLRLIIPTGEVFPTPYLAQWKRTFPEKTFVNMFGPTETTVECTYYVIDVLPSDMSKNIPIGRACGHLEVFALKEDNTFAGVGEVGELCVRGPSVGLGYWNNPEKTRAAFADTSLAHDWMYRTGDLVELQSDGNYILKGRKDHQIKFMGYRIELGEIEVALHSLPSVKEAVALFSKIQEPGKIVAFAVLQGENNIKEELSKIIPKYMIPQEIHIVENLPRTTTGKINRVLIKEDYEKNFNHR